MSRAEADDQFGPYRLVKKIGTGGMADVYRAERRGVSGFVKTVAIKRMLPHLAGDEHFLKMFIDEARIAASLDHSNIVSIHDFGQIDGQLYLVMEYVEGWNLSQVIRRLIQDGRLMPLRHALFIALEVCKGLQAAHTRSVEGKPAPVVHRDVSPQNVLLSTGGEVKIGDFGVAKTAERLSVTRADSLKGKLAYMSPEQATAGEVDNRSDIFSTGIVMHEMLTSQRLFRGRHEAEMLLKVLQESIAPPSKQRAKLPPEVDAMVMKALDRDPARRYASIVELGRDISSFLLATRLDAGPTALAEFLRSVFPEDFPAVEPATELPAPPGKLLEGIVAQQLGQIRGDAEVAQTEGMPAEAPKAQATPAGAMREDSGAPARMLVRPDSDDTPATNPGASQTQLVGLVKELAGDVSSYEDVGLWVQVALLARLALISTKASEKRERVINAIANAARGAMSAAPRE